MPSYRIYLLDDTGRIALGSYAECAADEDAYVVAAGLLGVREQAEIWLGTRRVGQVSLPLKLVDSEAKANSEAPARNALIAEERGSA